MVTGWLQVKPPTLTMIVPPGATVAGEKETLGSDCATAGSGASTLGAKSASPSSARNTGFAVRKPVISSPLTPLRQKVAPSYRCVGSRQPHPPGAQVFLSELRPLLPQASCDQVEIRAMSVFQMCLFREITDGIDRRSVVASGRDREGVCP